MSTSLLALAGAAPIVTVLLLMAWRRWPAARAMGAGWLVASALGLAAWRMRPLWWLAAALYGALQALDIILIVFGAILLMNHLRRSGAMGRIRQHLGERVQDARIQLLLIGLGLMPLLEGVAGFGTPAALGAPLLTGLGFSPTAAATLGLMFNSPNPPLGAAGVPVNGGIGAVIDAGVLQGAGLSPDLLQPAAFLRQVAAWTGLFTGSTQALMGMLGVYLLVRWFGAPEERSPRAAWRLCRPALPVALALGLLAGSTQGLVGRWLGPELPAALAGLVTLAVGLLLARRGWLMPRTPWRPPSAQGATPSERAGNASMSVALAWVPYALVVTLLLLTRLPALGLREPLQTLVLRWPRVLGQDLSWTMRPLTLPGVFPFIPVAVLTGWLQRMPAGSVRAAWGATLRQTTRIAVTLMLAVSLAQVMIRSAQNPAQLPGMMQALSQSLAGPLQPLLAPWLGALGAFVTGSNTSSNILFSVVQFEAAGRSGLSRTLMVALQNAGGGLGTMLSVVNIAAVCGVLGLQRSEGELLRRLLVPAALLATLVGLMGLLTSRLVTGLF
ncbi:MAG: L-lactate permease [Anaerolineae bacterium]